MRGTKTCKGLESAQPPERASASLSVWMWLRCAKPMASAIAATVLATMIWLHNLVACPAPLPPMWVTCPAYALTACCIDSKYLASPPTMMAKVPALVPAMPPDTGASSQAAPWLCKSLAAKPRVACGEMLEWSTSHFRSCAWAMPFGPKTTDSTDSAFIRHINTPSTPCAACAGLSHSSAPCATNAAALPGVRFHTCTLCPAASKRWTMAAPIKPRPQNPSFMLAFMRGSAPTVRDRA